VSKLKKALLSCHIFHKRLLLRPTFIILIALVPVIGLLLGIVSRDESGIMTVYLAGEGETVSQIIDALIEDDEIIRFIASDEESALSAVENGRADSAWIFKEDFDAIISDYAKNQVSRNSLVTVVQRDDTVSLMLAREKLCGALYPFVSREFYLSYVEKEISPEPDKAKLLEYYDSMMPGGEDLFEISSLDGTDASESRGVSYLVLPLRGLLSVMVVLAGLSVEMAYKTDEKRGIFCGISKISMPLFIFGYYFFAVCDVCVAVLLSLLVSGMVKDIMCEIGVMLLLAVASILFCIAIERICRSISMLSAATPIVIIVLIVVCPVFFNIDALYPLQLILPPYYYLNAVYNAGFLIPMLMYIAALTALDIVLILSTHDKRKLA